MSNQQNENIKIWARKVLDGCEQFNTEKELKIRIAKQYGFLKACLEILEKYPEDIEFVAKREMEKEGEKECKTELG